MKKAIFLLSCILLLSLFAGCSNNGSAPSLKPSAPAASSGASSKPTDSSSSPAAEEPELDISRIYGLSPDGEEATLSTALNLTQEDLAKIAEGNYRVAICMHQVDNDVNAMKVDIIKKVLANSGVEVITVTDGQSSVEQMVNNLETVISMKPDLIISIAYDVNAMVPIFQQVRDAGIKLVFFECAPTGFVPGKDYYALVSTDYFGSGRFAAEYMAYSLNYEGTVGMVYYDADVWTCNERDQAFRDVMAKYPGIEIVMEAGFADPNQTGTTADAILAQYPDIDGIYTTWDTPADETIASAKAVGRDDLIITTVDLGENSARVIAEGGMIKAVGAARSFEDGETIANAALYALLEKNLAHRYIATPTQGVTQENVLDAYAGCFNVKPPDSLIKVWEAATGKTWTSPF